jgi:cephalosporin hydroxylase
MTDHMPPRDYTDEIRSRIESGSKNQALTEVRRDLLNQMNWNRYAYNFSWFGRPVIQIPQDAMTFQEMIWEVRPDLIIETGIAHGGSLIFSASMLALLELFGEVENPLVLGIDIDIRSHNRKAIEEHPAFRWIEMIQGSSTDPKVCSRVKKIAASKKRVMVFLDSDHTHNHVLDELRLYSPLVSVGSFLVTLDTGIEDIDQTAIADGRPWGKGNSPKSALNKFMQSNENFLVDSYYHEKAWFTSAPGGIIRRIS